MINHIKFPAIVKAAGNRPKIIEEYVGRVNSDDAQVSIARMKSPEGWQEPAQTPEFTECSLVLHGVLRVSTRHGVIDVKAGEAIIVRDGEQVQYSTPDADGAEYISVCVPAFSPATVHRESEG